MDTVYGVEITNKFELFVNEDDDPLDILNKQAEQKALEKKSASTNAKQKTNTSRSQPANNLKTNQNKKSLSAETTKQQKDQKNRNESSQRLQSTSNCLNVQRSREPSDVKSSRIYIEEKENLKSSVNADFTSIRENVKERGQNSFNRRGGLTRSVARPGRREFDRHSGTEKSSVKAPGKRDGGGAHNWGTMKDDLAVQLSETAAQEDEGTQPVDENEEQTPADNKDDDNERAEDDANETASMTLDEWKALQTSQRLKSSFNIRKAGEGCSNAKWKNTYVLKKKEDDETESDDDDDDDEEEYNNNYNEKHVAVPIEIRFKDTPRRGRGGRARRGEGRPDRSGRAQPNVAPNVSDERDFPTLGK